MRSNVRPIDVLALEARVRGYEKSYGVSSERMFDAFTVDGVLDETPEFLDWSFTFGTLREIARLRRAGSGVNS